MHRRTPKIDAARLLATCAYIDLNPVAAGLAPTPEASAHTSFRQEKDGYILPMIWIIRVSFRVLGAASRTEGGFQVELPGRGFGPLGRAKGLASIDTASQGFQFGLGLRFVDGFRPISRAP